MTHTKTNVIQYNEFYAHGSLAANSWTRDNTTGNNFLANGGTELNNTSGNYQTDFRDFDPVLGRMNGVDIMSDKYSSHSPYSFAFNNPVSFNDPSGADPNPGEPDHVTRRNLGTACNCNNDFSGVYRGGSQLNMFENGWGVGSGSLSYASFAAGDGYFHAANLAHGTNAALHSDNGGEINVATGVVNFFDQKDGMIAGSMYMTRFGTMTTSIAAELNKYFTPIYASLDGTSDDKFFEGVRLIDSDVGDLKFGAAFTLPGIGIFLSYNFYEDKPKSFNTILRHEFGHILQAREWGNEFFYEYVATISLGSAYVYESDHKYSWTERTANYFSNQHFGWPTDWNHNRFPVYMPSYKVNNNDTKVPFKGLLPIWWDQRGQENRN